MKLTRVPLRFRMYCVGVDMLSALKEFHHKIVRRVMESVKCDGCGLTISVYRMEHHTTYKVDGITNCEAHQHEQKEETV